MVILFLPFKLILFQYGTFAVIIILLLHAIPSIMNGKYYCLGKGFVVGFVEDFFFFLILSTAIISELIYSLKSPLSTALLHSVASKGGKLLLQSSKSYKKVLQLFCWRQAASPLPGCNATVSSFMLGLGSSGTMPIASVGWHLHTGDTYSLPELKGTRYISKQNPRYFISILTSCWILKIPFNTCKIGWRSARGCRVAPCACAMLVQTICHEAMVASAHLQTSAS